ncbi:NAD(P)/FAD-dependent oxidoreductase [bacterium]|nr:NAD(P)/FAD-dependent oxidoreductase [bacterium]
MNNPEVLIIGAGGAGMMCAIHAARRGRKVLLLDHSKKLGGKILISGGGRCNFTNTGAGPANYVSRNPHFAKSALSRYSPDQFIEMVRNHGIAFHEKKLGQLFCDQSAQQIVDLLKSECDEAGAEFLLECPVKKIGRTDSGYKVETPQGEIHCQSLVVATGGLSIPKLGATGLGYQIARQFGLKIVETVPALDGFTFSESETRTFGKLAGLSIDCQITAKTASFRENILFTHAGLSGPAALQASLHWDRGEEIEINLLPETPDTFEWLMEKKKAGNRAKVTNLLSEILPSRFADCFTAIHLSTNEAELPLPQVSEKALKALCENLHHWKFIPKGTVGYSKAEVTRGGVDTDELSSKTMESKKNPGLYFIGEVVDVTGWLGGYNFQWAWASGWAAGQVV